MDKCLSLVVEIKNQTTMATIKFLQRTTKDKNEIAPIYVRVTNGRSFDTTVKTELLVKANDWNQATQRERNRASNYKTSDNTNNHLKAIERLIIDTIPTYNPEEETPKEWLLNTLDKYWHPGKYETEVKTLFQFIEHFIKQSETAINPKTGHPVSYRIRRDYERTFELLKNFAGKKKIDFKDIDLDFYNDFVTYLQKQNFKANTVGKFIKNLKVFLNKATEEGINTNLKYKSHRFVKIQVETESVYLNEKELKILQETDLSNKPHLERTRDLFLVGCWTGLRFGDLSRITSENIKDDLIHTKQAKTGERIVIPLHPVVKMILNKYEGQLPTGISNQKTNEYLKDVCEIAKLNTDIHITETRGGIKKSVKRKKYDLITSHTARRSFATNLYKSGFPSQSIMKITGHKSESSFLKYLKVTPEEHAKLLADHWLKSNSHLKVV